MKADDSRLFTRFMMRKDELAEKIKLSIGDSDTELWFPNLTTHLADFGWNQLQNEIGITSSDYGTTIIIADNINVPLQIIPFKDKSVQISIELFPKEFADKYFDSQISFYDESELTELSVLGCLAEAIELIKTVPELWESVQTLVKSLHLIKLEDDNYDVSFSEPHIPFSIFVSVPKTRIKNDSLRVAEAIVHEAMHLQLSLIEKVVPLISSNKQKFYSPWKDEYRHSDGILHALYVFRVIDGFYKQIVQILPAKTNKNYLVYRRNLISQQVASVNKTDLFQELTECGKALGSRLVTDQI